MNDDLKAFRVARRSLARTYAHTAQQLAQALEANPDVYLLPYSMATSAALAALKDIDSQYRRAMEESGDES